MADVVGELYATPAPDGANMVERAALLEHDPNSVTAGRLVGVHEDGRLHDSLMPFAEATDAAAGDDETFRLLAQVATALGYEWRWYPGESLVSALSSLILDTAVPVGTVRMSFSPEDTSLWLVMDGRRMGNAYSNAVLAGPNYENIFKYLWNRITGNYALKIYDSSGAEVVRGESANADWLANRQIAMPDYTGRSPIGFGLTAGNVPMGGTGGVTSITLRTENMPSHKHVVNSSQVGAVEPITYITAVVVESVDMAPVSAETSVTGLITVTVDNARAEEHTHAVNIDAASAETHTHLFTTSAAFAEPHEHPATLSGTGTDGMTVTVQVQSQPAAGHTHGSGETQGQGATSGHRHNGSSEPQAASGPGHKHNASGNLEEARGITSLVGTPGIKLKSTTATKNVTSIGSGNVDTEATGENLAFDIRNPYVAMAFSIRY